MSAVSLFVLAMNVYFAAAFVIEGLRGDSRWSFRCFLCGLICAGFVMTLYLAPVLAPHLFRFTQP